MRKTFLIVSVAFTATAVLGAQPLNRPYRQIASAGVTIGGHTLTPDTTITAVALNDRGEVAFAANGLTARAPLAISVSERYLLRAYRRPPRRNHRRKLHRRLRRRYRYQQCRPGCLSGVVHAQPRRAYTRRIHLSLHLPRPAFHRPTLCSADGQGSAVHPDGRRQDHH